MSAASPPASHPTPRTKDPRIGKVKAVDVVVPREVPTVYLTAIAAPDQAEPAASPAAVIIPEAPPATPPPQVPPLDGGSLQAARAAARSVTAQQPLSTSPARSTGLWRSLEDRDVVRQAARQRVKTERLKALEAFGARDWVKCETALSEAIRHDRRNPGLYAYRSHVRLKQDRTARALQDAGTAISLDPRSPRGYYRYGRTLCHEQRLPEAGASFIQGLGLDPSFGQAQQRCNDVLTAIRRQRNYWPGRARPQEKEVLSSTPPPSATAPAACAPPQLQSCEIHDLRVTWEDTEDDGGDPPYRYELQMCRIDPLDELRRDWDTVYYGIGKYLLFVENLESDTEYAFRVSCQNAVGRSEWSPVLRCSTKARAEVQEQKRVEVPVEWAELNRNLNDVLTDQLRKRNIPKEKNWQYLLRTLNVHQAELKLAFRLYTRRRMLIGSQDDDPNDMSMAQFLTFVKDTHIRAANWLPSDDDMIFILANREVEAKLDKTDLADRAAVAKAKARKARNEANPDGELLQHEFVSACVRLAALRFLTKPAPDDPPTPGGMLHEALELLLERHIIPFATFEVQDELTLLLRSRGVRAAIAKYADELKAVFSFYARLDRGAADGVSAAAAKTTMNLAELMLMLKEAGLLDEACTAREVCCFFVKVNMDDELYEQRGKGALAKSETSAVLEFDEFVEIVVRICNEKVPAPRDGPFEQTLATWLGLMFLPAVQAAAKARKAKGPQYT